ncbi:MAG: hypothetical protein CM15mP101_01470 [Flavobacteriaceae bacterium]|nr:MAG: hypothetical protein CM15mP101_01470 [Flavobacteriaceae bacterium]
MEKKKNKLDNQNNSNYWIYGLIISIFIIFSYFGNSNNFSSVKKINITTFEKYLNSGDISNVIIINKTLAEITLSEGALVSDVQDKFQSQIF